MASNNIESLSEATYDAAVAASAQTPLVVDFWAPWCGPCKALAPVLEALATEFPGLKIAKVNVDENPDLAAKLNILAIPNLLYYKGGVLVGRGAGTRDKESLRIEFKKLL